MAERATQVARKLSAPGKNILAADESQGTIKKRFDTINVDASIEENRRAYRELFLDAPFMEDVVSGVILFDETTRQSTADGRPFVELLQRKGVQPGVKVDGGLADIGNYGEKSTKGLDKLEETAPGYIDQGLTFFKFRTVFNISDNTPTDEVIELNNETQAGYARISQDVKAMPIVEPEILREGDHSIERCAEVSEKILTDLFDRLQSRNVDLTGMILKTNMILPGKDSGQKVTDEEIAKATVDVLAKVVPKGVPAVAFLSNGNTSDEAVNRLRMMNRMFQTKVPFKLMASFGQAFQSESLKLWRGIPENVQVARGEFLRRVRVASLARSGVE